MNKLSISVVTPSYNQGKFLSQCLVSVASQTIKPLEHIIFDPGSTDNSRQIAENFGGLDLVFEPDSGQSDAINKGFSIAKGDLLCWLNSDDYYPNSHVFEKAIKTFNDNPDCSVVYGNANFVGEQCEFIKKGYVNSDSESLLSSFEYQVGIIQPSVFIKREVFEVVGGPPLDMDFTIDYEYWVRIAKAGFKWAYTDSVLSHHRWWSEMKTASRRGESYLEHLDTCLKHFGYANHKWISRYAEYLLNGADGIINTTKKLENNDRNQLVQIERLLYTAYNFNFDVHTRMHASSATTGMIATLHRMRSIGLELDLPISNIDSKKLKKTRGVRDGDNERPLSWKRLEIGGKFAYLVENEFSLLFERGWFDNQLKKSCSYLNILSKTRLHDTCIIVGNGPSLNDINLDLLKGQDVFISNFAYYNKKLIDFASFYTVTNRLVAEQGFQEINQLKGVVKIFPFYLNQYLYGGENTIYLDALLRNEFSMEVADWISWRSTVSFFNLQLAYTLGYKKVILIGFDHSYNQQESLVEGDIIEQVDDDENHFDPNYFKGKKWQAADVGNMEKCYAISDLAFKSVNREIVNCTVGGNLEIFRRSSLESELTPNLKKQPYPKVLIFSSSEMGSVSATGILKETLFSRFPKENILQIYTGPEANSCKIKTLRITDSKQSYSRIELSIAEFNPDVIYFRPTSDPRYLFDFAYSMIKKFELPLITHLMDDWMSRLKVDDPVYFSKVDKKLRELLSLSSENLSICDSMSIAFNKRYGCIFKPFANCVQKKDWSAPSVVERNDSGGKLIIRYCGGIAEDMNLAAVLQVAQAVDLLNENYELSFEIYTMPWYIKYDHHFTALKGVQLFPLVPSDEYVSLLKSADILILANNFDKKSKVYIQYSMANKLPEYLASGTPILAVGPIYTATFKYINDNNLAFSVATDSVEKVKEMLIYMIENHAATINKASKSMEYVFLKHDKIKVVNEFTQLVCAVRSFSIKDSALFRNINNNIEIEASGENLYEATIPKFRIFNALRRVKPRLIFRKIFRKLRGYVVND